MSRTQARDLDRALALAAVLQACSLVEKIARTGAGPAAVMEPAIQSVFVTDPGKVLEVYGQITHIEPGLHLLQRFLDSDKTLLRSDTLRYALTLIRLEPRLRKNKPMQNTLAQGIDRTRNQLNYFHCLHDNVMASLAGLYMDTVSTFRTRVQVAGQPRWLHNNAPCINRIRACLLAAMRSVVLWRQVGGRPWQLVFSRRTLLEASQRALAEA